MITLNEYRNYVGEDEERLLMLTLDEFFNGNTDEFSIAPNQADEGRPALAEIWEMLKKVEKMSRVAWIRIALHDDTEIENKDGVETLYLSGDSIAICTDIEAEEVEEIVDCEWLCSGGVTSFSERELEEYFINVPEIPDGYEVLRVEWD